MLQITHIDHISMAVPALEPQIDLLRRLFGFRPLRVWHNEREGYRAATLAVPGTSAVEWELLAPAAPQSSVQRFLDGPHGPGLHHVSLRVPDVRAASAELRRLGVEPWDPLTDGTPDGARETYIHPQRGGNGFLFHITADGDRHALPDEPGEAATTAPAAAASEAVTDALPPQPPEAMLEADYTLGIVAINHLAHAHPDRDALGRWYAEVLGMEPLYRSPDLSDRQFLTAVMETTTRQLRWEVIQPGGPNSFVQRFLDRRGPAMHHVTFEVGDWTQAIAACEHHDVPIFGEREGETDGDPWREAFIHPRHTSGLLVQFFWQERPGSWI